MQQVDGRQSLQGKVALVTGAAQGIGRGVALALARAGSAVALVDTNESALQQVCGEVTGLGVRAMPCVCDVAKRDAVDSTVAQVRRELGPVYVLVNNAIAVRHALVEGITDADLDLVVHSGVYGSLYFMQACFPDMKAHGGRIMNFGSGAATMGLEAKGAYAIAKEALRGLTKVAATEWGPFGITVNNIMPSVRTPLYDEWFESLSPEEQAQQRRLVPMRRHGDAELDVGALIVFLAGPGGGFITSRTLHVDGGRAFYDR